MSKISIPVEVHMVYQTMTFKTLVYDHAGKTTRIYTGDLRWPEMLDELQHDWYITGQSLGSWEWTRKETLRFLARINPGVSAQEFSQRPPDKSRGL